MDGMIYLAEDPDGEKYVGQTIDPLSVRKNGHKKTARKIKKLPPRDKQGFPESINEHGFKNIEWYILEDGIKSAAELTKRETYYIKHLDTFHNGLNLTEKAAGGGPCSDETKQKLSEAFSGEKNPMFGKTGKKSPNYGKTGKKSPCYGLNHTDATKQKMSESTSGEKNPMFGKTGKKSPNYRMKFSDEHKRKLGKSHMKPISINCIIYESIKAAAKDCEVSRGTIYNWLKSGKHEAKYL